MNKRDGARNAGLESIKGIWPFRSGITRLAITLARDERNGNDIKGDTLTVDEDIGNIMSVHLCVFGLDGGCWHAIWFLPAT